MRRKCCIYRFSKSEPRPQRHYRRDALCAVGDPIAAPPDMEPGELVELSKGYGGAGDAADGPLWPGQAGKIVESVGSYKPYCVKFVNPTTGKVRALMHKGAPGGRLQLLLPSCICSYTFWRLSPLPQHPRALPFAVDAR